MESITFDAPAKINLYLDIVNKRRDGYHNIETIFQKISLYDRVKISTSGKGISIYCRHPGVPLKRANLCYKAAQLMIKEFDLRHGIDIYITKSIPTAAGLGGGSSDAASVIMAINKLFNLNIATERLMMVARDIGADVPFFVSGHNCAIGKGIGERLREIRHKCLIYIVVMVPDIKLYTKTIYSKVSLPLTKPACSANMFAHVLSHRGYSNIGGLLYNRLEDAVLPSYPIVREVKEILSSHNPEGVLLSGSGPACFAIFNERKEAVRAKEKIEKEGRWQLFLTRTI